MSEKGPPQAPLDATVSSPGVVSRRASDEAHAVTALPGSAPATGSGPAAGDDGAGVGLRPGDTLGRYVLGASLGTGGMGHVFRARDPDLGRELAIKVLRTGGAGSSGSLERRLLREAQAMATLSHDNLALVFDIGVSDGRVFVVMELIDGTTLRALIADGDRSWRDKLAAVVAAGRGLAAAHSAGVIHRDFKPDNVLIARSGRVKVVDFGLARAELDQGDDPARADALPADLSANLTQTGALLGTPTYMAPEQHAGAIVDARADQFAFAVTAWEAVYGRRPFPSDTYAALVAAVRSHGVVPPPRGTGVPAALEVVLRRALAAEPRARFTSMDALLAAIEQAIRPRRTAWWLAGAAAVALTGGGAAFALTRDRASPTSSEPVSAATDVTTNGVLGPNVRAGARPGRIERNTAPAPAPRRTRLEVAAVDLGDVARAAAGSEADVKALMLTRMAQAAVVRAHQAEAVACYERAEHADAGTIVVEYQLGARGEVVEAHALENGVGDEVAACLLAASRTWRFAPSADGQPTTVRFPYTFTPASGDGGDGGDGADVGRGDAVRIQLPPMPGLPDGLDVPLPPDLGLGLPAGVDLGAPPSAEAPAPPVVDDVPPVPPVPPAAPPAPPAAPAPTR